MNMLNSETEARSYVKRWANKESFEKLELYARRLVEENQKQNLISRPSEEHLWVRHLADSAQLLEHVPRETYMERVPPGRWLDLGTGPGLPGLVIAILCPRIRFTLVESRKRRVEFLETAIEQLELKNCEVEGQRLEVVKPFEAWVISARAFAPLEKLLTLSSPFSTKRTRYLLPKGCSAAHELEKTKPSIRNMFHVKHSLTDAEAGIIVSK